VAFAAFIPIGLACEDYDPAARGQADSAHQHPIAFAQVWLHAPAAHCDEHDPTSKT
jgi:hypothetical protein